MFERDAYNDGFRMAVVVLALLGSNTMAGSFDLRINDVSGLDAPWPLVGGLPFPEGELHDGSQIRVVGADGAEVPAQVDVTATWRDGSIRWALVGFHSSPQEKYRVEFGSGIVRHAPAQPLRIERDASGGLTVDTGAAVYEFLPDRLLPESARIRETVFLAASGDGAYLVDQRGRRARVAGSTAEIVSEIVNQGPARAVVRRAGWYVTADGQRVARARVWFYFAAGSPYLRVTHSLILTEDTNDLWVRDYGLEFRAPEAPGKATFALGKAEQADDGLLSMKPVETESFSTAALDGGEVFMLQDVFPHFLEREARAIVARGEPFEIEGSETVASRLASSAQHRLRETATVGDWADAAWDGHGLTVVVPWLAQRFPKEIAFGPQGARVGLWSGRSGRELDFRTATLVKDYWQRWSERAPEGVESLAAAPSNARGAARTHDVWLLPHAGDDPHTIAARARAASQPPLVLADPCWLTATEAVGWPMHPMDDQRFPEEEAVLSEFWDRLMASYEELRRTGFIAWGDPPHIRGAGSAFFRVSGQVDYGLRRHVWGLYARSGDRRYYDYGARFNRFAGDWSVVHHAAGEKFVGGFTTARQLGDFWSRPLYWGTHSALEPAGGNTGHDIVNWLLEYYLTGDEYVMELTRMHGEAFKAHWEQTSRSRERYDGIFMILRVLADLYAREWDEDFGQMARELARYVIDLDSPNGINDAIRFGSLYKVDRNLISLYFYYRHTGDPSAREAFLRGIDYEYRFHRVSGAFAGQAYPSFLFSVAYRWTGDPNYRRVVHASVDEHRRWPGTVNITSQINPTMGLPAALGVLAEAEGPITAFPVARQYGNPPPSRIVFRKPADRPLKMRLHLRMSDDLDEDAAVTAVVRDHAPNGGGRPVEHVHIEAEAMFRTAYAGRSDPRRRHVCLSVPAAKPPGLYTLEFPGAEFVDVLDTDAPQVSVYAPEGFRTQGARAIDYFRVADDVDTLRIFLGVPAEVRRPDGSVALEADAGRIGEQQIPAAGHAGVWSLNAAQSGIVRLLNAEPLFSREPQWLATGADVAPAPRFERPSPDVAFVPGRGGRQALHMPGNARLGFLRGAKTARGYEHFPGREGTVEFWFRPNWSSCDLAYAMGSRFHDRYFLRAGSHDLQYRRGQARASEPEFASLNLWAHGRESNAGFTGRFWFKAGEWYHLAFTWRTLDGAPGADGDYAVYVNGQNVKPDDFGHGGILHFWPGRVTGGAPFHRREADEIISIGPLDGTIAQLRISDTVRYPSPYEPLEILPEPDARTRIQFPLDGSPLGETVGGERISLDLLEVEERPKLLPPQDAMPAAGRAEPHRGHPPAPADMAENRFPYDTDRTGVAASTVSLTAMLVLLIAAFHAILRGRDVH